MIPDTLPMKRLSKNEMILIGKVRNKKYTLGKAFMKTLKKTLKFTWRISKKVIKIQ